MSNWIWAILLAVYIVIFTVMIWSARKLHKRAIDALHSTQHAIEEFVEMVESLDSGDAARVARAYTRGSRDVPKPDRDETPK
jgi:hypothetical protein